MEGFRPTFNPYTVYGSPVCLPPAPGGSWGKRDGRFVLPQGLNYPELCKTLLSQLQPASAAPPAGRADTRECGVQVNAKVDKAVQCSLGPKTLPAAPGKTPGSPDGGKTLLHTPPVSNLRFPRPVSIYSPVFDRRFFLRSLTCGGGDAAKERSDADPDRRGGAVGEGPQKALQRPKKGAKFQFLEQRYGFFHCNECNIRWESAYVWCISGTSKVYYKQLCRKCQVGFNPYRVESILCKGCSQSCCSCEKKQRHINMKRPHRQDLCCRCKGMRLSCDITYSFKYIV